MHNFYHTTKVSAINAKDQPKLRNQPLSCEKTWFYLRDNACSPTVAVFYSVDGCWNTSILTLNSTTRIVLTANIFSLFLSVLLLSVFPWKEALTGIHSYLGRGRSEERLHHILQHQQEKLFMFFLGGRDWCSELILKTKFASDAHPLW